MSDLQYRIKVETTNGGQKKYIPQVGTPKLSVGRTVHMWLSWEGIVDNHDSVSSSKYSWSIYDTKEEALRLIERYKNKISKDKQSETKIVEYIKVD
jgi:hypothetical protein